MPSKKDYFIPLGNGRKSVSEAQVLVLRKSGAALTNGELEDLVGPSWKLTSQSLVTLGLIKSTQTGCVRTDKGKAALTALAEEYGLAARVRKSRNSSKKKGKK